MPKGFVNLQLNSTTKDGIPTSGYQVQFEKHNLGNIAVRAVLVNPNKTREMRGRLSYRYFSPNGIFHQDHRAREGFTLIIDDIEIEKKDKVSRVLLKEGEAFFGLGFHRLEVWWQEKGDHIWRKAGAIIFEVVW